MQCPQIRTESKKLQKPSVLITDGDLKVTLPVLRSLAKRNIETGVAGTRTKAMAFFSKYCKRKMLYPSPRDNLQLFLRTMKKTIEESGFNIIFPIGEWTLVPISDNRELFADNIKLPFASKEAIQKTFNKSSSLRIAADQGVPIPETHFVNNTRELKEASRSISYPAVIKSRCSWVWNGGKALFSRPTYVNSPEQLIVQYEITHNEFPFPMIQEYIPGTAFHIGVLCNNSRLKAACCVREHRTIPVTGGYATLRESVALDHKMKEYAIRLLEALDWHGVAEVEFKLDPRDSTLKFMEINGRFWGSLELAIRAGVDFPFLLYRLAVDGNVKPVFNYETGVKSRWFEGDLIYLSNVLKGVGRSSGVEYPTKWHALKNFLKFHDSTIDCLYWDDPLPFLSRFFWGDIPGILSRKLSRMRERTRTTGLG